MKNSGLTNRILWGLLLVFLSFLFYLLNYAIFKNAHDIFFYLIDDIAFVFIQVLLVTVIIEYLLASREKSNLLQKLNMVIGAFFSEVGTDLLKSFTPFDTSSDMINKHLMISAEWSPQHFKKAKVLLSKRDSDIDCATGNLEDLQKFLADKRGFLLRLLENPNLLEHELFTELLWAVFHLSEELSHRQDVKALPDSDYKHLAVDIKRAYHLLLREWLSYIEHLKNNYPYPFSLALRTNPFDPDTSPQVK
jgi:hypothetical protein